MDKLVVRINAEYWPLRGRYMGRPRPRPRRLSLFLGVGIDFLMRGLAYHPRSRWGLVVASTFERPAAVPNKSIIYLPGLRLLRPLNITSNDVPTQYASFIPLPLERQDL